MARIFFTRDRDAFPKTFSRRRRSKFSRTVPRTSQWDSNVFVSASDAPTLMIFDVYGGQRNLDFFSLSLKFWLAKRLLPLLTLLGACTRLLPDQAMHPSCCALYIS